MRRLLLAAAVLLVSASPATADFPGVNGQIAFDRGPGFGGGEVWLSNQDGAGQHKIANGREPSWSPDGKRIAYVTGFGGTGYTGELGIMNADGGDPHLLNTDLGPNVSNPSWSPDGRELLVSAFGDIYAVPLAGGRARLLFGNGAHPAWSPDGSRIGFVRGYATIMVANADGTGLRALTPSGLGNTTNAQFSWSPDGKRIAFASTSDSSIDVIDVDHGGVSQLVPTGEFTRSVPAWSPDGTRIAFLENADLCTVSVDGSNVARLTYTPINPGMPPSDPAWQPLPAGSAPAGEPGGVAGPPRTYPRGTPWYPSCDRPEDRVTISSKGPSTARVGVWATYVLTVRNGGAPISPITVTDALSRPLPAQRPAPSQGRCSPFRASALPGHPRASECELGALLPGDTATIRVRVRLTRAGTFTNTGIKGMGSPHQQERSAHTQTRVRRG